MMNFYIASDHLYGLAERSNSLYLSTTNGTEPYRLFSVDKFPHAEF